MKEETLTELLMRRKRVKVLNTLLENGDRSFTITELSDKSGVGYKTTHSLVGKLKGFGIINVEEKGGSKITTLNENSPYVDALEKLGGIDSEPLKQAAEKYSTEIKQKFPQIKSVLLFGSVLQGLPTMNSDIDLLILVDAETDKEQIEEKVWAVRDKYQREQNVNISPIVMTKEKFKLNAENREPFASKVKKQGKVLEGEKILDN